MESILNDRFIKLSKQHARKIYGGVSTAPDLTDVSYEEFDSFSKEDPSIIADRKRVSRGRSSSTGWYYTDVQYFHKKQLVFIQEHWTPFRI